MSSVYPTLAEFFPHYLCSYIFEQSSRPRVKMECSFPTLTPVGITKYVIYLKIVLWETGRRELKAFFR